MKMLQEHSLEAVILDHSIDPAFISHIEMKKDDIKFKRVDSDISELMKDSDQTMDEETHKKEAETLTQVFKKVLNKEECKVQLENLKSEDVAGMIILSEENRRMQEMMKRYSIGGLDTSLFPNEEILVLNKKHPLIQYILIHSEEESELRDLIIQQVYDLAVLSHKPLSSEAMTDFIKRSSDIMKHIII